MVSLGGLVGAQPHSIVDEAGAPHELTVYARGGMSPLSVTPSQLNTLRGGVCNHNSVKSRCNHSRTRNETGELGSRARHPHERCNLP